MNELYHHGIKGMHWGVRRFQNSDGTLTAAGRQRYSNNSVGGFFRKQSDKNDSKRATNAKPKRTLAEIYSDEPSVRKHVTWDKDGNIVKISKPLEKALDAPLNMIDDEELIYLYAMELGSAGKRNLSVKSDRQLGREAKHQRTWNAKNASQLSDKELTDQILRLQREKQLKQLTDDVVRPGRKKVKDLMDRYGNQILAAAVTAATTAYVTNKINPHKSTYESMREQSEAQRRLAREGYYQKHYDNKGNPH